MKNYTKVGSSQDAWIFHSSQMPKITGAFQKKLNFPLGKPGCDNRIAFLIHEMGFPVVNPMKKIRCYHFHRAGGRTYHDSERIRGSYKMVPVS